MINRGLVGLHGVVLGALVLGLTSACGGGGDDDSGTAGTGAKSGTGGDATGGSDATGGTGGSDATGGKGGSGGSDATGGTGGGSGSSGSSGASSKGGSGSGGGGSTNGDTEAKLDAIGEVCEADCDAQFATDCAPANSNTLTCEYSCAAATAQLGDFCLDEYRDYIECRGDGGYDCVNDFPYQRSTCVLEQTAYSTCAQHIGCKRYCKESVDQGCSDVPFDDCFADCTGGDEAVPADCSYQIETIAYCQVTAGAVCVDGALSTPAACASSVLYVAECVSDESGELCDGWCWAANRLGCGGDDCAAECAAKKADATCGNAWNELLDCVMFFGDGACVDGAFNGNGICDSEVTNYKTCMDGGAMP
jgi:hypothetical protein